MEQPTTTARDTVPAERIPRAPRAPIFICGCHRTGTTLLQKTLSRHPAIDILPETKLFAWLWSPLAGELRRPGPELIDRLHRGMPLINRAWGLPENEQRLERLGRSRDDAPARFEDTAHVMEHVLRHCAGGGPRDRVGEKTPLHIYHVDAILRRFPDARILITSRDLRAGFLSQMRRADRGLSYRSFRTANYVGAWTNAMRLADDYCRRYSDRTVRIVRFESLVEQPERELASLCEFLDLPFDDKLLDARVENSSFEGTTKGFAQEAADRWHDDLPPRTIEALEYLAGKTLERHGYDVGKRPRGRMRLRMLRPAIALLNWAAHHRPAMVCFMARDPRFRRMRSRIGATAPAP